MFYQWRSSNSGFNLGENVLGIVICLNTVPLGQMARNMAVAGRIMMSSGLFSSYPSNKTLTTWEVLMKMRLELQHEICCISSSSYFAPGWVGCRVCAFLLLHAQKESHLAKTELPAWLPTSFSHIKIDELCWVYWALKNLRRAEFTHVTRRHNDSGQDGRRCVCHDVYVCSYFFSNL